MYQGSDYAIRDEVRERHANAYAQIAEPGSWFTGSERIAIIREARHAQSCILCRDRKAALSPYVIDGNHDSCTDLGEDAIEVIHRLATDSGRLTEAWFQRVTAGDLTREAYVEIVGVLATGVILDSYATAIGLALTEPGPAVAGAPDQQHNPQVFDGGAWVPMLDVPQEASDTGLPTQPNIARAMGLVPGAMALFFPVMRAHYSLSEIDLDLSRAQIELLASRVSSHNQCFY